MTEKRQDSESSSAADLSQPSSVPSSDPRARLLERLLDLAHDASSYLRHHAKPAVRVSAALLLAASIAACNDAGVVDEGVATESAVEEIVAIATPLASEVSTGLPNKPGRYPIVDSSLRRDAQGVYHFSWRDPNSPTTSTTEASVSRVRLAEANENVLEIVEQGDPILHLRSDTPIQLAVAAGALQSPTPQSGGSSSSVVRTHYYPMWYPFVGTMGSRGPAYYDPPTRSVLEGGTVRGSTVSSAPRPPAERTIGLSRAVSGRAGGTGSGTAATRRSGANFSSDAPTGGKSGVLAPRSGGFSSGSGGFSGGGTS